MKIRSALFVAGMWAFAGSGALAQDQIKAARIGLLLQGSEASSQEYLEGLHRGLAEQGLIEGKHVSLEYHYANGQMDRLPKLAAELAGSGVDLIFSSGDQAAEAAKQATSRIPIVVVTCDALAAGLVTNLPRPGGNLTGVTCISADLDGKRVQLIKEALPSLSRLSVMFNPGDKRSVAEVEQIGLAAKAKSIELLPLTVIDPKGIGQAFATSAGAGPSAAVIVHDSMLYIHRKELAETAIRRRVATIFTFRENVDAGGLISYGPNVREMCRQSARLIKKVLTGQPPGELPMEQPTRFELVVNLKTAKAIGVELPASLIDRADDVIE